MAGLKLFGDLYIFLFGVDVEGWSLKHISQRKLLVWHLWYQFGANHPNKDLGQAWTFSGWAGRPSRGRTKTKKMYCPIFFHGWFWECQLFGCFVIEFLVLCYWVKNWILKLKQPCFIRFFHLKLVKYGSMSSTVGGAFKILFGFLICLMPN